MKPIYGMASSLAETWEPKHVIFVPRQSSRSVDSPICGDNNDKRADRAWYWVARPALSMAGVMSYAGAGVSHTLYQQASFSV